MSSLQELASAAREWADADPDPSTAEAWRRFVESANRAELEEALRPLSFGTAGLRAKVGPGPSRMNEAVVRRAARAVAKASLQSMAPGRTGTIIVGHDARTTSRDLATIAARVVVAAGVGTSLFRTPVPTPLVAYAAKRLGACAAIVITASHNPPEYNGMKVYGPDAAPIADSWEQSLSAHLLESPWANRIPLAPWGREERAAPWQWLEADELLPAYLEEVEGLRNHDGDRAPVTIVYTPLHGVGGRFVQRALAHAGHDAVHVVSRQFAPDGRFPTLDNPNPEDPSALQMALELAEERRAALVLASDPDADRLAVCVRDPAGEWRHLSGNEIGILLADDLLERAGVAKNPLLVSTIVSTPMVEALAAARGARAERTLTGFKWLWRAAGELSGGGHYTPALAFEEAIGFSPGSVVRDKDGMSSAVLIADLAARAAARGETLLDRLRAIQRDHGVWVSGAASWVLPGAAGELRIRGLLDDIVGEPPRSLAGHVLSSIRDWRVGAHERAPWLGATDLATLEFAQGRLCVRPSGTEPKLKVYVDWRAEASGDLTAREACARGVIAQLIDAFAIRCALPHHPMSERNSPTFSPRG